MPGVLPTEPWSNPSIPRSGTVPAGLLLPGMTYRAGLGDGVPLAIVHRRPGGRGPFDRCLIAHSDGLIIQSNIPKFIMI